MLNSINLYFNCIKAEFLKIKNSKIIWVSLLGPLVIIALQFSRQLYYAAMYIPKPGINPWIGYFSSSWQAISFLLLPFYLILISNFIVYEEHKSDTWKDIFILPINTKYIFISKFTVVLILFTLTLIYFNFLQIFSGLILGYIKKEFLLMSYSPDYKQSSTFMLKIFLSSLSIVSLQFWLSLRNKNYIVPISIGIMGIVFGIMIFQWKYSYYIPFTYPTLTTYKYFQIMKLNSADYGLLYKHELMSLVYLIVFTIFGYWDYKKLKSE
ncbi:MAG: ABC transporter permease [Bacteroidota bacterium]|nr:ABC transporter permease [Bacteroidota bacterium]